MAAGKQSRQLQSIVRKKIMCAYPLLIPSVRRNFDNMRVDALQNNRDNYGVQTVLEKGRHIRRENVKD